MLRERQMREGVQVKLNDDEPSLVLPQLSKLETKAYTPAQFEGALGRLTASSIHNPRQMITVHFAPGSDTDEARGVVEVKRFKEMLLRIEKGYNSLLDIEDTEKKALALPPENRQALYDERTHLIAQLYRRLKGGHGSSGDVSLDKSSISDSGNSDDDDGIAQIIAIRKGLYLVLRLAPLLDKADAQNIVCLLLRKMATRKDWQTEVLTKVYKAVSNAIQLADLQSLVLFAGALCQGDVLASSSSMPFDQNAMNRLMLAIQNKFGVSVTLNLLNRGEVIYSTQSPLDLDAAHQNDWRQFVESVASAIELCDKSSLCQSMELFQLAGSHLRRLLDKHSMLLIEDWLEAVHPSSPPLPPTIPVT
jgi:DNA topoisomerase 2-associated protein PAT1